MRYGYAARGFMCLLSLYVKRCAVCVTSRFVARRAEESQVSREALILQGTRTVVGAAACAPFGFSQCLSPPLDPCRDASCESCLCCFTFSIFVRFRPYSVFKSLIIYAACFVCQLLCALINSLHFSGFCVKKTRCQS